MRFSNFFIGLFISIGLVFLANGCRERCTPGEPTMTLRFYSDSTDLELHPVFDDVRGLGANKPLNFNSNFILPLSINHDSSYFVFTRDGEKDTLGFTYLRNIDAQNRSYCVELRQEELACSTFRIRNYQFGPCRFLEFNCPGIMPYEVHIYL